MAISDECLRHAEECEAEARTCGPGSSRDTLLETAAVWRRMAATAKIEEATWHLIARNSAPDITTPDDNNRHQEEFSQGLDRLT